MTTSTKLIHEKDGTPRHDENGNNWALQRLALEKELSSINSLLQNFSGPDAKDAKASAAASNDKNGTNAQLEINLLEKKCICLLKLKKNSETVREASSILAKRSPPSNTVFKCVIIALCRLGQIEEARKVIQQWAKSCSKDHIVNDFKDKLDPYLQAAAASTNPGEAFRIYEMSWPSDWFLTKNTSRSHLWKYRPPPRFASALFMCPHGPERCRFGNECVGAHSNQELSEWKQRVEMYNKNWETARGTKPCNGLQYLHDISKRINETTQIRSLLADELSDVKFKCAQPLKIKMEQKRFVWKMLVVSKSPVRTVSLLHDVHRNNFWISAAYYHSVHSKTDIDLFLLHEVNGVPKLQVANTFVPARIILNQLGGWPEWFYYKLELSFHSVVAGSFRQTVMFDFKTDPKLVKHIAVELQPSDESEEDSDPEYAVPEELPLPPARPLVLSPNNTTFFNGLQQIPNPNFDTNEKLNIRTESAVRPPQRELVRPLTNFVDLSSLSKENYIELMDKFLQREIACMQDELSKLDGNAKLELTASYAGQKNFSSSQSFAETTLYAKLDIGKEISEDTKAGRLLIRTCQKVILLELAGSNSAVTKPKSYEFNIVEKLKSAVIVSVDSMIVQELNLKRDTSYNFRVRFVLDDRSLKEMRSTLGSINENQLNILFPDLRKPVPTVDSENMYTGLFLEGDFKWLGDELNEKQKEAYHFISTINDASIPPLLIIGPFGTGKTYTLAQCLKKLLTSQEVKGSKPTKILVCTHSNSAADLYIMNYLHGWFEDGLRSAKALRVYYADRMVQTVSHVVKKYCLFTEDGMNFRYPTREEVMDHQVVIVTLSTSIHLLDLGLEQDTFSHIILDEAAQATETEAIQPLRLAGPKTKIVLAGDHMQLSPEIFSSGPNYAGISLIDRMEAMYGKNHPCKIVLTENYRSHEVILKFASDAFYGGLLHCASLQPSHPKWYPITFFSARGEDVLSEQSSSYYNMSEVFEVADRVEELIKSWPDQWGNCRGESGIAVLTAYSDQVGRIRAQLRSKGLGFVSVERILNVQGKQFRAVIVSTVRTRNTAAPVPETTDMGFLSNPKLLNTAMTRAQSLFAVVGDPVSLCSIGNCRRLWDEIVTIAGGNNSLYGISQTDLKRQLLELEMQPSCHYNFSRICSPIVEPGFLEDTRNNNYIEDSGRASRAFEDDDATGVGDGSDVFEKLSSLSIDGNDDKQGSETLSKLLIPQVASIWSDAESAPVSVTKVPALSLSSSNIWAPLSGIGNGSLSDKSLSSSLTNIAHRSSPKPGLILDLATSLSKAKPVCVKPTELQRNGFLDDVVVNNVIESVLNSPMVESVGLTKLESPPEADNNDALETAKSKSSEVRITPVDHASPRIASPFLMNAGQFQSHNGPINVPLMYPHQNVYPVYSARLAAPYAQQPYYVPSYGQFGNPVQPLYTQAYIRHPSPAPLNASAETNQTLDQNDFPSLSESLAATKPTVPKPPNPAKTTKSKKQSGDGKKQANADETGSGDNANAQKKGENRDGWVQVKSKKGKTKELVPVPTGEEKIDKLVSMGFEKKDAIRALQRTNRNIEEAIEWLLTKSSPQEDA